MNEEQLQRYEELARNGFMHADVRKTILDLASEVRGLQAKLAAVPVDDIKKVNKAAENDGYSNWAVAVWLDELAMQQR